MKSLVEQEEVFVVVKFCRLKFMEEEGVDVRC